MVKALMIAGVLCGLGMCSPTPCQELNKFRVESGQGGLASIRYAGDRYDTNYIAPNSALGRLFIQYRNPGASSWKSLDYTPEAQAGPQDLKIEESFQPVEDRLDWTIKLGNSSPGPIEVGDLGIDLPMNNRYGNSPEANYTKSLIRHAFIGEESSFIFWMRTNAEPPYLLMLPGPGTELEYFDVRGFRSYMAFILSKASGEALAQKGGTWRFPHTSLVLAPNASRTYSFRFVWADGYKGVEDRIVREGGIDPVVMPGMTVPTDLDAEMAFRTGLPIRRIAPELPSQTLVQSLGTRDKARIYRIRFSHLGENLVWVSYGDNKRLPMQFFVTEPLETLIKKRAQFLVNNEQVNDSTKWFNAVYGQWDMKAKELRTPDNRGTLPAYSVACDDPALGKAPFLALKNIAYPNEQEVASIERYLREYVWGGLQETTSERYPYAIYGIDNWKENRDSPLDTDKGKRHVWRIYDYPHLIALYYYMYRLARDHPGYVHYLDWKGYLDRAFGTAIAYFTVPMEVIRWSAYETGTYNECVIPPLIEALQNEGRQEEADQLRQHWERKVAYFVNEHPYLYGSEYSYDTTAFESTEALAKFALSSSDPAFNQKVKRADALSFLQLQMRLNMACRGNIVPDYYLLGSDLRGSSDASYTLSYMSQMGGSSVLDYGLNFAQYPTAYLRLGYASLLSSWALLNSGSAASNYGYWYPGVENDGAAAGGFEPRPWGVAWLGRTVMGRGAWRYSGEIDLGFTGYLRSACTIVTDDPLFGTTAYGGVLSSSGSELRVTPRDGPRARLHVLLGNVKLSLTFSEDGFAKERPIVFDRSLRSISFKAECRSNEPHPATLQIAGLPAGRYSVWIGGKRSGSISNSGELSIPAVPGKLVAVRLRATG